MSFLRNIWYVAGHSEELDTGPVGRTLLNEPVLVYRTERGDVVAMDDRCPHRLAPLSKGKIIGDAIQCPYHGLRFDGSGRCVELPIGGQVPPRATLRTYPIVERHSLLWIWMGDTDSADASLIPDFSDRDDPSIAWFAGTLHCNANYQLLVDNLLDLTHAEFLHPFLSSEGWARRNEQTVSVEGEEIVVRNIAENDHILPVMAVFKPTLGAMGTTIQTERWHAPSLIRLSVDYYSGDESIILPSAHLLTPETEKTTHYFVRGGQTIDPGNSEITAAMRNGVLAVFRDEDIPIIEAQQRYIGDRELAEHHPAVLKTDHAPTLVRRTLAKRIRLEEAERVSRITAA